jgi:hypothetical protein
MLRVSTFPDSDGAMDSLDASNVYITGLTKLQIYFLWLDKNSAGISENSADASATTVQNIPDSPDISLNDVSFTSMTVHMETVYAADKNVTSFDVSWNRMTVPWIARMPQCLHHGIGRSYNIYFLWLDENAGISENSADASNVQNIPILLIFRSTTCPSLP